MTWKSPFHERIRCPAIAGLAVLIGFTCWAYYAVRSSRPPTNPGSTTGGAVTATVLPESPTLNRWPVAGGGHITLDFAEAHARLIGPAGDVLHNFDRQELVHGSSLSRGRSCLLLLVVAEDATEPDAELAWCRYAYVLQVWRNRTGDWRVVRRLRAGRPFINPGITVAELGEVSNDGKVALLKMCVIRGTPPIERYEWQTRDLIGGGKWSNLEFGGVPSMFSYFRPRDGNPFVLAWFGGVIALWILGFYWIFARRGAEFLVEHPGLLRSTPKSPAMIRIGYCVMIAGGILGLIFMCTMDFPEFTK